MSTTPAGQTQGSSYGAVLSSPHVARLPTGTQIGRLPTGMAPVAILLLVRAGHGSLALDGGTQGLVFVAGPLLATGFAAGAGAPTALVANAAVGLVGAGMVVTSEPSAAWRPDATAGRAHRTGPLRVPGLRVLFAALAGTGVALGAVNVLALASAEHHHAGWLAGVMPAALSVASMLGGLAYGRHAWPGALGAAPPTPRPPRPTPDSDRPAPRPAGIPTGKHLHVRPRSNAAWANAVVPSVGAWCTIRVTTCVGRWTAATPFSISASGIIGGTSARASRCTTRPLAVRNWFAR
ncbi:hypothetical protein [Kitasatospora purpeofusca]|uniref:Uncharacterized protein n=1 Tax=Kitasatospora purpeofusca TaxID=67352 RepID=A0ABZ1UDJ7_9ACTN|nr:hypothetical protein [Kitasatospora purpeofusca]